MSVAGDILFMLDISLSIKDSEKQKKNISKNTYYRSRRRFVARPYSKNVYEVHRFVFCIQTLSDGDKTGLG